MPDRAPFRYATARMMVIVAVAAFSAPAFADEHDGPPTLSVVGEGSASAAPDLAVVRAGVETAADTAAEALAANTTATTEVIEALKAGGVASRDIQTANFSVQPRYADYNPSTPRSEPEITGYSVINEVVFRARDLDAIGGLLDTLVSAGSNRINGISFEISDEAQVADEARREAVADARRKAELYADAAGARLLRVLQISESVQSGPGPMPMLRMESAARADVPIERGENEVRATISMVWEIAPQEGEDE